MREIPYACDTNLWRSVPTVLLIYTGCFTNYIVLIIYCLISVCMENSFCGLYIQKSKTNITELSRKEGCDRNRRYQQNATSCYPGPRGFHLFFTGKFCDANRFYYFCYRHEAVRALKASGRDR